MYAKDFIAAVSLLLIRRSLSIVQQNMLVLMDTKALNHVLSHPVEYEKPPLARKNLASLLGQGEYSMYDT